MAPAWTLWRSPACRQRRATESYGKRPQDERAREAIRAFCARSPDYHAAWEEAKRVYRVTGEAVGPRPRRRTLSRRQVVAGVAAVAAGSVTALQAPGLVRRLRADEVTAVGASSLAIADWLGRNLLFRGRYRQA